MIAVMYLTGSLGLFLYGMKIMSEGIAQAAGQKMQSFLEIFTKNKWISMLVGTFFTALIQSANGSTVLMMSFVNGGLLELSQIPGFLLGVNLGGSITGQMLSFDPEYLAPVLILGGACLILFGGERKTALSLGKVLMGFGLLFTSVSGMTKGAAWAGELSAVQVILEKLSHPLLAFGAGILLGCLFQSELAATGLLAVWTGSGWLGFSGSLYMLLGANIGVRFQRFWWESDVRKMAKGPCGCMYASILREGFSGCFCCFWAEMESKISS